MIKVEFSFLSTSIQVLKTNASESVTVMGEKNSGKDIGLADSWLNAQHILSGKIEMRRILSDRHKYKVFWK